MLTLLQLILRNGGFVSFVLLEAFCFYVIVQYNERQNSIWGHSAGLVAGDINENRQNLSDYVGLRARVDSLTAENAVLLTQLANARMVQVPYRDTFYTVNYDSIVGVDSVRRKHIRPQYEFIAAKVIANNISGSANWIMINKGSKDGLSPNLGVVTASGIIGILRHVDDEFSMVMSVLHRQTKVSVSLPKYGNAFGSLVWEGGDPSVMTLRFIPKHFQIKPGDLVETSGLSQIFPKGIPVGKVETEPVQDDENPYFLQMKVRLSQDLSTAGDVYVVSNLFKSQIDSLQQRVAHE